LKLTTIHTRKIRILQNEQNVKTQTKAKNPKTVPYNCLFYNHWFTHNFKKGLPGMLPSMPETLEQLYSCERGVL
jgi:hypothetical protein